MDMVWTEAVLHGGVSEDCDLPPSMELPRQNGANLQPIDYKLELIEKPDGTYEWVED